MNFRAAAVAVVLAWATASHAQLFSNVLVNPGFESGSGSSDATGWHVFNNAFRYTYAGAHGGSYALDAFGNWYPTNPPDWNASGAYQEYPASEGQIWEGSAWFKVGGAITGQARASVNVEFYDAASNLILQGVNEKPLDSTTPVGQWIKVTTKARCYRATAKVRLAVFFLQSPDFESGSVWIDDASLYVTPTNFVEFAGRTWLIWDGYSSPGINFFSSNSVFKDSNGWLHLAATHSNGVWHAAALETTNAQGFGEYRWYADTKLDQLDTNLVLGLFTYASEPNYGTNQNEVDIETSHSFPGPATNALFYTVQPYNVDGNGAQFALAMTGSVATHRFFWRPDEIHWQSYYGHTPEPAPGSIIGEWRFRGRGIPIETNERTVMNLWLFYTNSLRNTQGVEYILRDFIFTPFDGFVFADDFNDGVMTSAWEVVGSGVEETNGSLEITPPADATIAGFTTTNTIHRNERGTKYVFSALLKTVDVTVARSGPDVRTLMSFSSGTNSAHAAAAAAQLQGDYDAATGDLTVYLYMKANATNSDGALFYRGVLSGASAVMGSGGIELRMELEPSNYAVRAKSAAGADIAMTTTFGSPSGTHALAESLVDGYWFVGGQNSALDSAGFIVWDRASVGIDAQGEQPEIQAAVRTNGQMTLQFPGFFGERYRVDKYTNLFGQPVAIATGLQAAAGGFIVTDAVSGAAGYYGVRREP